MEQTETPEGHDGTRPYTEPDLIVEGSLEELTMTPTFLLEAYG